MLSYIRRVLRLKDEELERARKDRDYYQGKAAVWHIELIKTNKALERMSRRYRGLRRAIAEGTHRKPNGGGR